MLHQHLQKIALATAACCLAIASSTAQAAGFQVNMDGVTYADTHSSLKGKCAGNTDPRINFAVRQNGDEIFVHIVIDTTEALGEHDSEFPFTSEEWNTMAVCPGSQVHMLSGSLPSYYPAPLTAAAAAVTDADFPGHTFFLGVAVAAIIEQNLLASENLPYAAEFNAYVQELSKED